MESIDPKDCNSKELSRLLVGSIQRLIDLNQWNSFLRLQAVADPFKFIEDVATYADDVEKEDESKGGYHIRITAVKPEGTNNKIACIKALRVLMGWGLADSKMSFEGLPGSGHSSASSGFKILSKQFNTMGDLKDSLEWKEFSAASHYFVWDYARFPRDTRQSEPFK